METMPNASPRSTETEPSSSPEMGMVELCKPYIAEDKLEEIDMLRGAFDAGKEGRNEDYGNISVRASSEGKTDLIPKINEAFKLGQEKRAAEAAAGSSSTTETRTGAAGETLTVPETIIEAHGMWKALVERMKNLSPEEIKLTVNVGWKILKELVPEIARDIAKNKKIDAKALVQKVTDKFMDKIDEMPEGTFKGLRAFKETEPEKFKKFRTGLIEALDTKDFNECSRKLDTLFGELGRSGEVIEEVKGLAEIAVFLRNHLPEELNEEDRQRLEQHQASGYSGLREKVWPIGTMILSLLLIGLILTVILALSFSEGKLGKKKG